VGLRGGAAEAASRDAGLGTLAVSTLLLALIAFALGLTPALALGESPGLSSSSAEPHPACPPPGPGRVRCLAIVEPESPAPPAVSAANLSAQLAPSLEGVAPALCIVNLEYEYCGSGANRGFSPQDLQSAYRLPSGTAGSGQTVAIVDAYDDPNAQADLNVYRATYNLPPCEAGCFTKVDQTGGTSYPAPNASWALEISLDLDMVSATCPKCHILLVEANDDTIANLGAAENEAAKLSATEISNSFGAREIEVGKAAVEAAAADYVHPGIPITVASGDDGYINENFEHQNEKGECTNCSPSFPAGLASVIAVGGTEIVPEGESGRGWSEYGWHSSGGGCTLYAPKPAWQVDKGCATRTDNDVAAQAAASISVYDTYAQPSPGWQNVGGTSASAPLIAAAIALQSPAVRAEGVEGIYKNPTGWYDVTSGSNWIGLQPQCAEKYLCNALAGYDGLAGVGTPNGGATATPPAAFTEAATEVTTTSAKLHATVNAEASTSTYYFQYGATAAYGKEVPIVPAKVPGYTKASSVTQSLTELLPSTGYHYRVVAKSAGGTTYGADRIFATAPKVYASKFGSKGTGEGNFEAPQATAADAAGNVWVSDYANNRIEEFSATGQFLRACGSAGSGNGQFNGPTGIAVNPVVTGNRHGYVYVSDSGNNRIEVFSPVCKFTETYGSFGSGNGQLSKPMGLAFSRGGQRFYKQPYVLLVADSGNNRIEAFNFATLNAQWPVGAFVASFGSKGSGNGQFINPTAIVDAGQEQWGTENFFVVDSGNNRVQKIREMEILAEGESVTYKYLGQFGSKGSGNGQLTGPTGIALDPSTGDLAVTDTGNHRVEEFLPAGTYVAKFGGKGSGDESFEGPQGIAADPAGNLYVADSGNNRVDVWRSSPAPEWRITPTPNPAEASSSYLWGVSCPASTSGCTAVGEYSLTSSTFGPTAESWNGSEWSLQSVPAPAGAKSTSLAAVSCVSSSSCEAVGSYTNSAGTSLSLAEAWDGTEWKIQTTAEPAGTQNTLLDGVSCTSPTACTAVGYYENGSGVILSLAESWNGSEWKVQATPNPAGAKGTEPGAVSCTSATACSMAGSYESSAGVLLPFAEAWNGSAWSLQTMPTAAGATRTRLRGLSCTSATACTAVGLYKNSGGAEVALAERWNGSAWSLQTMPLPTGMKNSYADGVSCPTSTTCTAAGVSQTTAGKFVTFAERWNGTAWSVQSTPNNEKGEGWLSGGVSCASTISCAAVGNTGKAFAEIYG
jgi:hypothetical protein